MSSNTLKRRKQSTENYIDALLQNNSKLCAIRVDLKYKEPFSKDVSLDVINKDLKRMLDNRRKTKLYLETIWVILSKRKLVAMEIFIYMLCF